MGGESPVDPYAVVGANGAVAFRLVFKVVSANGTVIDFVSGEAVLGVESASIAPFITIAIVFAITMSEVALADDTFTSTQASKEGANATVTSILTVVSAEGAIADLIRVGEAVSGVDGADEAPFVAFALMFAIPMGAGTNADGTLAFTSTLAFIVTLAPTLAITTLAVANTSTITLAETTRPTAEKNRKTLMNTHFLRDRSSLDINFKS